jgi:ATP-dependent Clp protease ATP-binding subunit ClpC
LLPVSDHATQALRLAHEEARAPYHSYIGTEHILLALARDPGGAAARILVQMDVDGAALRSAVGGADARLDEA